MDELYQEQEPVSSPAYYAIIPADVRYDDQLPPNAKLLYGEISALIGADGYCFAGNQYFADIYKSTPKSIQRLITKLEDAGYIQRVLERDASGKVLRRKLYLAVSAPRIQPGDNFVPTPVQDCPEGGDKNVPYTNTSITNIEKENKKKKSRKLPQLTEEEIRTRLTQWIVSISGDDWTADTKNGLYLALVGFYEPRGTKSDPGRTQAALTALTNRLMRYSKGDPAVMVDMLERATSAGWRSVYPIGGDRQTPPEPRKDEVWL